MSHQNKVILIGLDGATFDIIYPMIEAGKLPTFSRLIKEGTHGVLHSTVPDLSPVAWTSMITGRRPGNHAIFDFVRRQKGSYKFVATLGGNRQAVPIWSYLSSRGRKVGVLNVTMSYPPEEVNGFIVSGLDAPEKRGDFTYPTALYTELKEKLGKYLLVNPYALTTREKHLQGLFEMLESRFAAVRYLMDKKVWEFFMVVFIATDGVQHFYWKDMDSSHPDHDPNAPHSFKTAIHDVYARIDEGLGEILRKYEEQATVVVTSDHGFQPLHKLFVLNNWLMEEGYLCLKKRNMKSSLSAQLSSYLAKTKALLKGGSGQKARKGSMLLQFIDWKKTRAFAEGTFGHIFINVKGRDQCGIVSPGKEYDDLCDEIIRKLKEVRDPASGHLVIEEAYRGKDVFEGIFSTYAPDLVVTSKENYFVSASAERLPAMHGEKRTVDKLFQNHVWSGNHASNGIFFAHGPCIKRGHKTEGANIIDVAPTVLYLLGEEIPKEMDGVVLTDIISGEHDSSRAPRFTESHASLNSPEELSGEEDESLKERLRNLGYLD